MPVRFGKNEILERRRQAFSVQLPGIAGGLNSYAYADGDPVRLIDPFGLDAQGESTGGSWLSTGFTSGTYANILGSIPAPAGYSPYWAGNTPGKAAYAQLLNINSLVNNFTLHTLKNIDIVADKTGLNDLFMAMPMFAWERSAMGGVRLAGTGVRSTEVSVAKQSASLTYNEMRTAGFTFTDRMRRSAFNRLLADIRRNGLQNPTINYVKIGDENYIVLGNNRLMAARLIPGTTDELIFEEVHLPFRGYKTVDDVIRAAAEATPGH
jgi:hypothetical protein